MKRSHVLAALVCCLTMAFTGTARAGAPQPERREGDFEHVCQGGPNKGLACTVDTEDTDCPRSSCVLKQLSGPIRGTLTIVAHDTVTDWSTSAAGNQALTVILEVKAPDGSKQILSATYQDLATPTSPPQAPGAVVAIPMDEAALVNLSSAVDGLTFVQPQDTLAQQLRTLFNSTGTPVLVGVGRRGVQFADHSADGLGTVLRFKVKIRF